MAVLDDTTEKVDDIYSDTTEKIGLLGSGAPTTPDPSYIAPTSQQIQEAGATIKDASSYILPDTTVAGQLSKLLSGDSEYLKQTEAKSKMTANALGMLSSDRYIGASTGAAIRESLPIATADAASASKFGLQQQQADSSIAQTGMEGLISGALKAQEGKITQQTQKTQGAIDAYLQCASVRGEASLSNLNNELNLATQTSLKNLENQLATSLMRAEYDQQTAENTRMQATSQIENTMISIENTLKDPDILQLGSEAVSRIINNQISLMQSGIELTYNLAKINVDGYVEDLLADFTSTYQWS